MRATNGDPYVRGVETYESFSYEDRRIIAVPLEKLRESVRKALDGKIAKRLRGDGRTIAHVVNGANTCLRPVLLHRRGVGLQCHNAAQRDDPRFFPLGKSAYLVDFLWRCRVCEPCLAARSYVWSLRAEKAYADAAVTWHGNVTLNPVQHQYLDAVVARRNRELDVMSTWTRQDWFRERCKVFSEWLSLWLMRVRKSEELRRRREANAHRFVFPAVDAGGRRYMKKAPYSVIRPQFQYLLVAEEHDGPKTSAFLRHRPHWHILLHETFAGELVRESDRYFAKETDEHPDEWRINDKHFVKSQWNKGHTQFKLVIDAKQVVYTCKYLSEDMLWRVRASIGYGQAEEVSENRPAEWGNEAAKVGTSFSGRPVGLHPIDGVPPRKREPGGSSDECIT